MPSAQNRRLGLSWVPRADERIDRLLCCADDAAPQTSVTLGAAYYNGAENRSLRPGFMG